MMSAVYSEKPVGLAVRGGAERIITDFFAVYVLDVAAYNGMYKKTKRQGDFPCLFKEVLIKSGMQIAQADFFVRMYEKDAGILDVFQGVFMQYDEK